MSISKQEFELAPSDWEGLKYAYGECRFCANPVLVCCEWNPEMGVIAYSSGTSPLCDIEKCGDKFPTQILRMATHDEVAFENIRCAVATATMSGASLKHCAEILVSSETLGHFRAAVGAAGDLASIISKAGEK